MCTLSWCTHSKGYTLYFNRDEQIARAKAIPPEVFENRDCKFIAPIDPDGGGSWISLHECGATHAILNLYEKQKIYPKTDKTISRGQLLLSLSPLYQVHEIENRLNETKLIDYQPFTYLFIKPTGLAQKWTWDGIKLVSSKVNPTTSLPISSSSVMTDSVIQHRILTFKKEVIPTEAESYWNFHCSINHNKDAFSTLMSRDDAATQSICKLEISDHFCYFHYYSVDNQNISIVSTNTIPRVRS